ncbi:MAG: hypothetical protein K2M65_00050, partial [Muribaculaceae bacterium]|nr:hypothetical protein [Muribaculaceae bacterium]
SQADYNQITDKQPRDIRNLIEGKLRYLQSNFGEEAVAPVVIIDTKQQRYWSEWEAARDKNTDNEEEVEVIMPRLDFHYDGDITIPDGYNRMVPQRETLWKLKPDSINGGRIWFNYTGYVFHINLDSLYNVSNDSISPVISIAEHNDSCAAVLVRISSYADSSCDIDGFIFKK